MRNNESTFPGLREATFIAIATYNYSYSSIQKHSNCIAMCACALQEYAGRR